MRESKEVLSLQVADNIVSQALDCVGVGGGRNIPRILSILIREKASCEKL